MGISQWLERLIVGLTVITYVVLAVGFSLGPIFEGPDEIEHYRFLRTLVRTRALPDADGQVKGQYHQAPLYYTLAALIKLPIDDADFEQIDGRLNPYHPYLIDIPSSDNKNVYLHARAEAFPYRESGVALAVHAVRLLSVAIGVGTLLISTAIFRLLWPDRPDRRLMALGFVAFWPQFVYLSGIFSNDNLLVLATTATLWLMLRLQRDGPSWRGALWLGVVLGAALLTKASATMLAFPIGLALLLDRRFWRYVPVVLAVALALAGWWYVRNIILYGDPTGIRPMFETWQSEVIRPGKITLSVGLARAPYAYETFWARFGHGAVAVAKPIYDLFDLLVALTVVGLAVWLVRSIRKRPSQAQGGPTIRQMAVVSAFGLVWAAALVYGASIAWSGNQGRYLLPGIAIWAALMALGLDSWTPRSLRAPVALGSIAVLAVIASASLFGYFLPAYRVKPAPSEIPHPLSLRYEEAAELIGVAPATTKAHPGETVRIELYWRALGPTETRLQAYLHSVGSDVVRRDSLPATGNLLSTDWQPGQTWSEIYVVLIPRDAQEQMTYPLVAGLYDPGVERELTALNQDGEPVTPIVGWIAVNGPTEGAFEPAYRFGGVIGLGEPEVTRTDDELEVCLEWVSLAPTTDYHVFVHVLTDEGQLAAQLDFEPKDGDYPTSAWTPGETIGECVTLDASEVPPHDWQVGLGLYDLAGDLRLPVQDGEGRALPDNMLLLSQ